MPQMSPLNWLMLFILFTIIFIMFCMINYFSFLQQIPQSQKTMMITKSSMNWKW
uniref:ATP synthase complex subunit 8 n=1 Tax=Platypalpus cursitans TaxID=1403669 RepID=A0A7G7CE37_9MUSC|nr:ATP synthase F0 subunit 8 [Platypalpus cursitans]